MQQCSAHLDCLLQEKDRNHNAWSDESDEARVTFVRQCFKQAQADDAHSAVKELMSLLHEKSPS